MDYDKKPESDDSKDKSESSEPKSEPKPKVVAAPEYVRGPGGKLTLKSKS